MSNPFDNIRFGKVFKLPGLPDMDAMLKQQAIEDLKKKQAGKKPQLLGGENAQMKAAPPKAIMKATPKELLGGPNAVIKSDRELVNFPKDINNIVNGTRNVFDNIVMGDWYDPDHQTAAYKLLHPQAQEQVQQAKISAQTAKTPNKVLEQAANAAIKGNVVGNMVNKSSTITPPTPQPQVTPKEIEPNTLQVTPIVAPNAVPAPITPPQAEVPANMPVQALGKQGGPPVPQQYVEQPTQNQEQIGAPLVPLQNIQQSNEEPSQMMKPIIQNPVEGLNNHIKERDQLAEENRPLIMKSLGLEDTNENWFRLRNNLIPPNQPWAMQHPIAATVSNLLAGLAQGSSLGNGNGSSLVSNLVRGLGQGATSGINALTGARDAYSQALTNFQQGAAAGIERGRVYNVPGTGLNTSLSAGELQSLLNSQQNQIKDYNAYADNYNDAQFALGASPKQGDIIGTGTQNYLMKKRAENEEQVRQDGINKKLVALQDFISKNPNEAIPTEMFEGIPYEALKGYIDPVTLSSIAGNQAQLESYKNKNSEFQQEQALKQYVMQPENWNDVSTRVRTEYGDEGYNLFYNAMQTGDPDKVFDVLKFLEQQKNNSEKLNDQKHRTEIVDRNSRRKEKTGRGARGKASSSALTPEQQSQSQSIYPGK